MKCLRSLVGVSRMERVRNEEVHMRVLASRVLASREWSESIEMVWACGKNGRLLYVQKDADDRSKWWASTR